MLLETIPFSYIARKAKGDLVRVVGLSTAVEILVAGYRVHLPSFQPAIPAFLGTAISLLLSFKLNQSYDRWWEARKVWGAIVNDSRTLVRQVLTLPSEPSDLARRIGLRQIAWCYCLGQSLRRLDWRVGTVEHLDAEEIVEVDRHANKPVALMQMHARDIARLAEKGLLSDFQRIAIDDSLTRLTDAMGKAERIRNTVFPRTYRLFLHVIIYLFITTLSVAVAEVEGPWQILITTLLAVPFLLLEKTALHMQDPFANRPTDCAVTTIARSIEIDLRQLMGDVEVPPPLSPERFYAM